MTFEYEARTEKEAIDLAASELGVEKDEFDVEILEAQKGSLFKKGFVKIRVHCDSVTKAFSEESAEPASRAPVRPRVINNMPESEFEEKMAEFVRVLIEKMGYVSTVSIQFREDKKLGLKIDSDSSSILIGKKGKNLDALQLISNIYAGRLGKEDTRIILDTENYRIRREESLVRLAYAVADKVRETKSSQLLEPMNPFERRLVHTTLNDINDIDTLSEGDGLYKQIRVSYKGFRR